MAYEKGPSGPDGAEPPAARHTPPGGPAPRDPPVPAPNPESRGERIYLELCALLREAWKSHPGSPLNRDLKVSLKLELSPFEEPAASGEGPERKFAETLRAKVDRALEEEIDRASPFPSGRLRCYWCGSFDCPHAAPTGPRSIFGGYTPTGLPTWPDLASVALERREPRIEDLYRESPVPITIFQPGSELVSAQLPVYGQRSGVYRILAQVAAGYLNLPIGPERALVAITIQAVEVDHGRPRVHLNVLGRLPDTGDVGRLLEAEPDSRIADALRVARIHLAEITPHARRRGGWSRERQAVAILERLARNLDRIFRQRVRRTKHSQDRHQDRERPAAAALRDAMSARPEEIYRDVRESTWVVLGPRSRVHIFNDAGQHVTSVVYPGETVRRRTAQGKWRAVGPDSARGFREAVERSAGNAS
jgi:hypothetical protein